MSILWAPKRKTTHEAVFKPWGGGQGQHRAPLTGPIWTQWALWALRALRALKGPYRPIGPYIAPPHSFGGHVWVGGFPCWDPTN